MIFDHVPLGKDIPRNSTDLIMDDVTHPEYDVAKNLWVYVAPILLFVGTVGSALSLLVLCQKSMRQQTTMFYLAVLAVVDVAVLYSGLLRLWLENRFDYYIRLESSLACQLHTFGVYLCLDTSVWVTVAVSLDRCIYVSLPHKAKQWCTMKRARRVIGLIVLSMALVNCHFFWTYARERDDGMAIFGNSQYRCYVVSGSEVHKKFIESVWPWMDLCVYCLVPFIIMTITTVIIIRHLVRSDRKMAAHRESLKSLAKNGGAAKVRDDKIISQSKIETRNDETNLSHGVKNCEGNNTRGVNVSNGVVSSKENLSVQGSVMDSESVRVKQVQPQKQIQGNSSHFKLPFINITKKSNNLSQQKQSSEIDQSREMSSDASTIDLNDSIPVNKQLPPLHREEYRREAFGNTKGNPPFSSNSKNAFVLPKLKRHTKVAPYEHGNKQDVIDSEKGFECSYEESTRSQKDFHIHKKSPENSRSNKPQDKRHLVFGRENLVSRSTKELSMDTDETGSFEKCENDMGEKESKLCIFISQNENSHKKNRNNVDFKREENCVNHESVKNSIYTDTLDGRSHSSRTSHVDHNSRCQNVINTVTGDNKNEYTESQIFNSTNNNYVKQENCVADVLDNDVLDNDVLDNDVLDNNTSTHSFTNNYSPNKPPQPEDKRNSNATISNNDLGNRETDNEANDSNRQSSNVVKSHINNFQNETETETNQKHEEIINVDKTIQRSIQQHVEDFQNNDNVLVRMSPSSLENPNAHQFESLPKSNSNNQKDSSTPANSTTTTNTTTTKSISNPMTTTSAIAMTTINMISTTTTTTSTPDLTTLNPTTATKSATTQPSLQNNTTHNIVGILKTSPANPITKILVTAPNPPSIHPKVNSDTTTNSITPNKNNTNPTSDTKVTSTKSSSIKSASTKSTSPRASYVSVTLITINVVFWLLNAPIMVYLIGFPYWEGQHTSPGQRARLHLGWTLVNLLQYSNSAGHFFLYCLTGPRFRQRLATIIASMAGKVNVFNFKRVQ